MFFKSALKEWRSWFDEEPKHRLTPLFLAIAYWYVISLIGTLGQDHLIVCAPLVLYYLGPRVRLVYEFLLPLFLTMIIYDSQRYFADAIRGTVHVSEPFQFDKFFFGIREGTEILTPNQWFQRHTLPVLDVITGFFYIAFVPIFLGFAGYFRILARNDPKNLRVAKNIMWAFFWLNMIGYSTYYWYPASPPWYVEQYGFGPARLDIPGSPAGCLRFDAALGTHIFNEWYGRAADVHGAIPSLHIAYPFMAFLYALYFKRVRVLAFLFYFAVSFSAVYLNHHYILDIIWGSVYAAMVSGWMMYLLPRIRAS